MFGFGIKKLYDPIFLIELGHKKPGLIPRVENHNFHIVEVMPSPKIAFSESERRATQRFLCNIETFMRDTGSNLSLAVNEKLFEIQFARFDFFNGTDHYPVIVGPP
jgi:hypothetical protein